MQPKYEKILDKQNHSFHVHRAVNKYVDIDWHYHPEIEITYIRQGTGTKYIGNSVSHFEPGEVVLIGPNIPHLWKNDEEYYDDNNELKHEDWVIQFEENFWGKEFNELPEMSFLRALLKDAQRGIIFNFNKKAQQEFVELFDKLFYSDSIFRIQILIHLLGIMAQRTNRKLINPEGIHKPNVRDSEKMLIIQNYVINNFFNELRLEKAADLIGLSVSGFCRYFKRITSKTFLEYVNEVRIEHTCKLLVRREMTVTAACYESGFNNFSNFSRQFNKVTGLSPNQYRKKFLLV